MKKRLFRFGTTFQANSRTQLIEQVSKAEDNGYSSLCVGDHLNLGGIGPGPFSTLAAIAAISQSLHIGSHVLSNDFWHPVVLAREAAAIDVLSDGRLEMGIGAGWWQPDYEATGIPFDPPGIRIDRLIEAVHIIKKLFLGNPVTFSGKHYTLNNLTLPKSNQQSHPRLLIGGGGKRILSFAAREAERVARQWETWMNSPVRLTIEDILESPHFLIGTIDQMVESLEKRREQFGLSYFTIFSDSMEVFCPVVARLAGK